MMRKKEEGIHMDFSRLKKYDLHCHLDGSLSKRVILKLARMTGADLGNVEDLESRLRVREDCRSLKEYEKHRPKNMLFQPIAVVTSALSGFFNFIVKNFESIVVQRLI